MLDLKEVTTLLKYNGIHATAKKLNVKKSMIHKFLKSNGLTYKDGLVQISLDMNENPSNLIDLKSQDIKDVPENKINSNNSNQKTIFPVKEKEAENFKIIDTRKWKRANHFRLYCNSLQPQYNITFEVDITNFYKKIKAEKLSFTLSFIHAITHCANTIEEFRYRFKDGKVVLYDKINPSFTYLNQETELFKMVSVEMIDDMALFVKNAKAKIEAQEEYFTAPPQNAEYIFSALPWISFTSVSHTFSGKGSSGIPLFDFGKITRRNKRYKIPFSVEVHHAFVDGIHIGKLQKALQDYLDEF